MTSNIFKRIATRLGFRLPHALERYSRYLLPLLVFSLAAVVLIVRLGRASLHNWDEAIYAEVAKEILQTGDWVTLHWGFTYWIDKPPLLMWQTALFFNWFGVTEFWARAASAFSGVALTVTTYFVGKHLYTQRVGFLAAIILLTTFDFIKWARNGMIDVPLALFTYLAVYGYLRWERGSDRWWYFVWIAIGFAIMLKALAALIAPTTIFLLLLFNHRIVSVLRLRTFWIGTMMALVMVVPWHVLMYTQFGQEFIDKYILYQISYGTTVLDNHSGNAFFYIEKLAVGFAPWSLIVLFALGYSLTEIRTGEDRSQTLLTLIALVLTVYSVSQTKLSTYLVPVYPALAILTAALIGSWRKEKRPGYPAVALIFCCLLAISVGNILPLYREGNAPVALLAKSVAHAERAGQEPLLVYANLWTPSALFYSNRPVHEVRDPATLASLLQPAPKDILVWKDDIQALAKYFQVIVIDEIDGLVYAQINLP